MGGERLMEFQETCTGGACSGYQENQRWIYFAGRKMFSKTGSTLKAIAPDRLASEAKHFPYGETDGTPPSDTKDYFATYRRDGTGLDYAWNRYYTPTMGRFTTADPYEASAAIEDPQTWNRYAYVANNPISYFDPPGLRYFFARWTECGFTYGDRYCYDYEGYFFDPASSSSGGGGEPRPEPRGRISKPQRPIDSQTDKKWRDLAKKAIESLSARCLQQIKIMLGVSQAELLQWSQKIHFFEYGGSDGKHSELSLEAATGFSPGRGQVTIRTYGGSHGNSTVAITSGFGDSILLDPDFRFEGNTDERRMATLTHELIHFAFSAPNGLREDDWLIYNFVQWQNGHEPRGGRASFAPSSMISKYIYNDCAPIDNTVY